MLTPYELAHIADKSEQIAGKLHTYILREIVKRMVKRIGVDDYLFTSSDRWRIETLQASGMLYEDITKELSRYTGLIEAEIQAAMEEACITAIAYEAKVYQDAGLSTLPLWESPYLVRIMESNLRRTEQEVYNLTATTASEAQKLFINACDEAHTKVISGAVPLNQAVSEAVDKAIKEGGRIEYDSGHTDTVEVATARAVRTGVAQTSGDITIARMEEMDWDIILVSAHYGARTGDGGENPGNHLWWQGKYYSRTGKDDRFPPFSVTGYGTGEGLCGWNCRHSFGSGTGRPEDNPYTNIDSDKSKKIESAEKHQRELERKIRRTKQEFIARSEAVEGTDDQEEKAKLQQKVDAVAHKMELQGQEYREYCEAHDLRTQSERLQLTDFNRERQKQSIAAAKRYNREHKDK